MDGLSDYTVNLLFVSLCIVRHGALINFMSAQFPLQQQCLLLPLTVRPDQSPRYDQNKNERCFPEMYVEFMKGKPNTANGS
jgi:hypothetical protein